jgi:hypothetical protein
LDKQQNFERTIASTTVVDDKQNGNSGLVGTYEGSISVISQLEVIVLFVV